MIVTSQTTDLDRLREAEVALERGDRQAALAVLTDLTVYCDNARFAISEAYDENLAEAARFCRKAAEVRAAPIAA